MFYDKIIPAIIYRVRLDNPLRVVIIKPKNKLVFFYPSTNGCHKFTKEDELPFDQVTPRGVVDVDFGRVLIFPTEKKRSMLQDTFLLETMDCNQESEGIITKRKSML